jgi:transmembrane sensor
MPADEQRLEQLFSLWYNRSITESETDELFDFLQQAQSNGGLDGLMKTAYDNLREDIFFTSIQKDNITDSIIGKKRKAKIFTLGRIAAAASIILVLGVGAYFLFLNKKPLQQQGQTIATTDVEPPMRNRAMITLANGQVVYLDSANSGELATQGNVKLVKLADGRVAYQKADGSVTTELQYNTLSNPKGSKVIDMALADGSHVWLNAGSSVRYPVAFIGNEREVEITGEAYFEVTKDPSRPFKVSAINATGNGGRGAEIEVLGTHFNVNSYDDEPAIKITLLEGKVKVLTLSGENILNPSSRRADVKILKPGEQASLSDLSSIRVSSDVDLDQVMAWKNGEFQFGDKSDIGMVMRQISRWYDVDVEYKGEIKGHIGGSISRNVNISKVLQMLEATGIVKYKIEGKKVIIYP